LGEFHYSHYWSNLLVLFLSNTRIIPSLYYSPDLLSFSIWKTLMARTSYYTYHLLEEKNHLFILCPNLDSQRYSFHSIHYYQYPGLLHPFLYPLINRDWLWHILHYSLDSLKSCLFPPSFSSSYPLLCPPFSK
jgi:hypothetical protein